MVKLSNLERTHEINFDNVSYSLNSKDLGVAEVNLFSFKGMGQVGEFLANRSINSREIIITGYVLAESKKQMRERKIDIQRIINPLKKFLVIIDDYKIECVASATVKYAVEHFINSDSLAMFEIVANCPNPCFTPIDDKRITFAAWTPIFKFPLVMNNSIMGEKQKNVICDVPNSGDIETGMIIKLRANEELTNPYLYNLDTREQLKVNKVMVKGEEIIVNTNYGEKSVTGIVNSSSSNYFSFLDFTSTFMQLSVGSNKFRYGADVNEGNLIVEITYSPRYLGV